MREPCDASVTSGGEAKTIYAGEVKMQAMGGRLSFLAACALVWSGGCGNNDPMGSDDDETGTDTNTTMSEKFDVQPGFDGFAPGDCGDGDGDGDGDEYDFSIIWVSNSPEGTVSKIDTVSAMEIARYATGASAPDPSRTSVNLLGDVAIANRAGTVVKIAAREEHCDDRSMDDVIQTSQAADDVLPWWDDECVLWEHSVEFPQGLNSNEGGPRAIAWDGGDPQGDPCDPKPNLWVGWRNQPNEEAVVRRLDGLTGNMIGEAVIPNWDGNWGHGTYGGASDRERNFWGLGTKGTVIKVDVDDFTVTRWENPTEHVVYGISLDPEGRVWLAGWDGNVFSFDPGLETFTDFGPASGPSIFRGLAVDPDGTAWIAGNAPCGLTRFDTTTGQYVDGMIDLPGCGQPVGVSIDFDGFVWVVDRDANLAYKVNPEDYTSVTVDGLVSPYTYSDMTGVGLNSVINPPQG
jgi:hypothetical protein